MLNANTGVSLYWTGEYDKSLKMIFIVDIDTIRCIEHCCRRTPHNFYPLLSAISLYLSIAK